MDAPYARIERAEQDAREQFPEASRVKGLWTPASRTEISVEVWHGTSARVHGWEPSR